MPETREHEPMTFSDPIAPLRIALRGRYEIGRQIGEGAYATVYLAHDLKHERQVALKVLNADPTSDTGEIRFMREIRTIARLQHPNILPLHDSGHVEAFLYYVMPYIQGETLRDRMSREKQLSIHDTCAIGCEIADALSYAHAEGIVHRDVKPENILLWAGHAIIADFGIARVIDAAGIRQLTQTGMGSPGTPAYMSPEQLMGEKHIDGRSDIYSLGCVLYEMLTGTPPFAGKQGFVRRFTEPPPTISAVRRDCPPSIDDVISKMLARYPRDRYQTASELAPKLTAIIGESTTGSGAAPPLTPAIPSSTPAAEPGPEGGLSVASKEALQPGSLLVAASDASPKTAEARKRIRALAGAFVVLLLAASSIWYWHNRNARVAGASGLNAPTSLAIVPFENLGRADDAYFAEGVTEEISSRIGRLSGIRLVGRQSERGYASGKSPLRIGKELGVAYVLTGSVRWDRSQPDHDRVRVSLALLRVRDATQVWSDVSEDELRGIFRIQSKVAEDVAQALKVHFSSGEQRVLEAPPTGNVQAYDNYLRGTSVMLGLRGSDMLKAVSLLEEATRLDPNFALAFVALGVAHTNVFWFVADLRPERLQMAKKAIDRALELDPDLPAAHNALGNYYYHGLLDFDRALKEFSAAQRLSPNDAEAAALKSRVERRQGKWGDALEDARQAVLLDPRNVNYLYDQGYNLVLIRSYDAADSVARKLIEVDSSKWLGYRLRTHVALLRSGDVKSALAILREAHAKTDPEKFASDVLLFPWPSYLDPTLLQAIHSSPPPSSLLERLSYFQGLGLIALYQGDSATAAAMGDSALALATPEIRGSVLDQDLAEMTAIAHAFRGDKTQALAEARRGPRRFPESRDAIRVADYLIQLGNVAAIVGANDEATQAFERSLAMPAFMSRAWLRTDPLLAKLRGNARFKKLLSTQ